MAEQSQLKFCLNAGLLVRRWAINAVTGEAWKRGLECSHERAGSTLRFTVTGDPAKLATFGPEILRWVKANEA